MSASMPTVKNLSLRSYRHVRIHTHVFRIFLITEFIQRFIDLGVVAEPTSVLAWEFAPKSRPIITH